MKNIVVIFGGTSPERDVSVITGVLTANSVKGEYNAIPIFVSSDKKWYYGKDLFDPDNYKNLNVKKLKRVNFIFGDNVLYEIKGKKNKPLFSVYAVINCLHGEGGEDGTLSGTIKMVGIPLCSPDILASSICMDKVATKYYLLGLGIKVLPFIKTKSSDFTLEKTRLKFPVIVKPTLGGSSIGIGRAKNESELKTCLVSALSFGDSAIIEPYIENFTEINCAVYKNEKGELIISSLEQPVSKGSVLSFEDKYVLGERIFPAKIEKKVAEKINKYVQKIYSALNIVGVVRIDFMIIDGCVFVNEINTVPGSLSYYLFSNSTKEFRKMLNSIILAGVGNFSKASTYKREFKSNILSFSGAKSAKRL